MRLLSKTKGSRTVSGALTEVLREINEGLRGSDGLITKINSEISAGPAGASVSVSVVVNGNEPRRKAVVGVNEKGVNREHSMKKATRKFNELVDAKNGALVDVFVKTVVTPLPGRVYTTIIGAINEVVLGEAQNSVMRRRRIRNALELLNNNPTAINVASVAEVFGVSRTIIYKDLDALGFNRGASKERKDDYRPDRDPRNR